MKSKELSKLIDSSNETESFTEFITDNWDHGPQVICNLTFEFIQQQGGHEGDGTDMSVIFKVNNDYFEVNGFHDSWNDNNWDNIMEFYKVVPTEKTIIVYEPVKEE